MADLDEARLQQVRAALEDRRRALGADLAAVEDDRVAAFDAARDTVEDAGDEAEDRREEEVRNAEESRDAGELHAIDAALARLDAGSYGDCVDCGAAIAPQRLAVQPAAARCIDCQQANEREGATHV